MLIYLKMVLEPHREGEVGELSRADEAAVQGEGPPGVTELEVYCGMSWRREGQEGGLGVAEKASATRPRALKLLAPHRGHLPCVRHSLAVAPVGGCGLGISPQCTQFRKTADS